MGQPRGKASRVDKKLLRAELTPAILDGVRARIPMRKIGEKLGISAAQVHKLLHEAMDAMVVENVDECRKVLDADHRAIVEAYREAALAGDFRAAEIVLKHLVARAKLNGANAPERHELTGADGGPIQMADARTELLAKLEGLAASKSLDGAAEGVRQSADTE